MEILNQLWATQEALEDALRLESTPEAIKETKEGKRLLKYLRHRRRVVSYLAKIISKI
jgi:hypothetical protein